MSLFVEDYQFGKMQEAAVFPELRRYFGKWLVHNKEAYAMWDFEEPFQGGVAVELKSRHCRSDDYSTAMIKTLKVTNCETVSATGRDCFLFFNFTDRLMFIEYEPTKFATYERRSMKIASRADKDEVWESRTFIPIADLKTLRVAPNDCLID